VPRYGGADRATGAQQFVADLRFPGALQVSLVTVPVGCADILRIDTTVARSVPGVVDVVTATQLPAPIPRFGPT
jgi:CO/xanthine dehydrogenase Mo-binding subunit